jgi:hypothetical protein
MEAIKTTKLDAAKALYDPMKFLPPNTKPPYISLFFGASPFNIKKGKGLWRQQNQQRASCTDPWGAAMS